MRGNARVSRAYSTRMLKTCCQPKRCYDVAHQLIRLFKMSYLTDFSPPQIFGIGLGRTGTTSLNSAFNILGYKSIHYPLTLSPILTEKYNAATDTLIAINYRLLAENYPQSKFVLTIRKKEDWLKSFDRHFQEDKFKNYIYKPQALELRKELYGTDKFDYQVYSDLFSSHLEDVLDYFRYDITRLLILNLIDNSSEDSWKRLCSHIRANIPEQLRFPNLNATGIMEVK